MLDMFSFLSRYFWLIALGFSAFNYVKAKGDLVKSDAEPVARLAEREQYLKRFAFCGALPWLIMGLGQLTGFTPTVWHYFRPQDGNPFVVAWFTAGFVLACIYAWWVLLAGGAVKVRDFNLLAVVGQTRTKSPSIFAIKALAAIGPLMFPVWVYLAVTRNVPLPM
jgi:hypothetical protein